MVFPPGAGHRNEKLMTAHDAETRPRLRKAIGGLGFFCLAFGSMIGVGWITTLDDWFKNAGPGGAMVAFVAGGLLMLLIGLCYAELTPMLPVTGGEVAYAYKAHGTGAAFLVGWFLAFGYLAISAFEAVSVGMVLAFLFPALNAWPLYEVQGSTLYLPHLLLGLGFTVLIMWINYRGVAIAMRVQVLLTGLLLACTALFVAAGLLYGEVGNLEPAFGGLEEMAPGGTWKGILVVFVTVPFWFVGFDTIPQAAEERAEGQLVRRLGIYILLAIVASVLFYVLVMLAAGMAAPWQETVKVEDLPTAHAFESAFESPLLANLVLTAGLIGLLTSWNGFFLAGTRVLFALGRGQIIDGRFGQAHPLYGTPTRAILFSGLVTALAACLGRGALLAFVDVGSFCITIAFLGVALSLLRLRRTAPDVPRPYRVKGGPLVAGLAAAGSLFILLVQVIPQSPAQLDWPLDWAILLALCICGLLFWMLGATQRRQTDEPQRAGLILDEE
jgi:amino acid transporter